MGRKEGRRSAVKNSETSAIPDKPKDGLRHANSLAILSVLSLSLGVFGALYYNSGNARGKKCPSVDSAVKDEIKEFAFLKRDFDYTGWSVDKVISKCVPIGEEKKLYEESKQFKDLSKSVTNDIVKFHARVNNFDVDGKYEGYATEQIYAVPEENVFAEQLMLHFERSVDFLYKNVKGIKKYNLEKIIIEEGDDYSKDFNKRVFFGKNYFIVERVYLKNNENPAQEFSIARHRHNKGGFNISKVDKGEYIHYCIFIGTGVSALRSPFSEVIPLTTATTNSFYFSEMGVDKSHQAEEAISEAISYLLSIEMAKKFNIPDGVRIIEDDHGRVMGRNVAYRYVPDAITWIRNHGNMEEALKKYNKEGPKRFLEVISDVHKD
ncbi:hypothetical protein GF336_01015 [Candidatus Woesearchaeota archaeon]|nr:hypothetical protein [Candidatus Woesearchaeota archaeon]